MAAIATRVHGSEMKTSECRRSTGAQERENIHYDSASTLSAMTGPRQVKGTTAFHGWYYKSHGSTMARRCVMASSMKT